MRCSSAHCAALRCVEAHLVVGSEVSLQEAAAQVGTLLMLRYTMRVALQHNSRLGWVP